MVLRELSVAEQRYQAILAVIEDGLSVTEVAGKVGVSRQTLHAWLVPQFVRVLLEDWPAAPPSAAIGEE